MEEFTLRVASPLSRKTEDCLSRVIDCAFAVHRELGPGFRERIYQKAYGLELDSRGVPFECEKSVDVRYKKWSIPSQRVDLIVEGLVVVETKAVPKLVILHELQVRSYLKTTGLRAGILVNFNTAMLKRGLRRVVRT
jgi:GxxExxY protein